VVVEEPHLGQHEGDRGKGDRNGVSGDDDQRQQPDQVLRREDLRERDEAGDCSRERDREPPAQVACPRVERPHGHDRRGLEHHQERRDRVRRPAREVPAGDARRLDHPCVVEAQPVEHEQDGGAEALDLEAARGLCVEALVDAVRGVRRERRDRGRRADDEHAERDQHAPGIGPPPQKPRRQRNEDERVDLRGDGEPEHREGRQLPAAQQQPECEHGEERGPRVVGVERDRAEGKRREREQPHRDPHAPLRGAELREHQGDEHDRRRAAERHQRLERGVVVRRAEGGRRQEDRERTRRVLDEDVAVGQRSVQQPLRVALVDVDVAKARRAEEPAVRDGACGDVDGDRDKRGAQRRLHVSASAEAEARVAAAGEVARW